MENSKISNYFLLVCLLVALTIVYFVIRPFFGSLILAAVFAFIFYPIYNKLSIFTGKGLSSFITIILAVVLVLLPLIFLGNQIFGESQRLYQVLTEGNGGSFSDLFKIFLKKTQMSSLISENLNFDFSQYLRQFLSTTIRSIGGIFSSFAKIILNLFVFLISFYYFLRDGDKLKKYLIKISPLKDIDDELIVNRVKLAVSSVVKGNLFIGFIQGMLTGIGFFLFGVPSPMLWGCVAAISALIPGVGTAIVIFPAVIYLFFSGNNFGALGLLIWGVVAVGLIDNFLGPKLVGKGMRLHPLAAFLAVIGGLAFFGPLGILLGPLSLGICLAFIEIYFSIIKPRKIK